MVKTKMIINADDCGITKEADREIEKFILNKKITSTTIMANMHDFEGAVRLYNTYHDIVSFGWHMNLTEGVPLLKSQILLDTGYYQEKEGRVVFNGSSFRKCALSNEMKEDIKKELKAQYNKIKDYHIEISHADSHHHIHTSHNLAFLIPSLLKELGIEKCRRNRNYLASFKGGCYYNAWMLPFRLKGLRLTEKFCSFTEFNNNPDRKHGKTIEIMCHPGNPIDIYVEENAVMLNTDFSDFNVDIITYNEL